MFPSTLLPQFSLQNRAINQDAPNRRPPGVLTEPMPISSSSQRLSAPSCPCCPYKSFAPLSLLLPYFFRSTWSLRISAACRMIRRSASRRIAQPLVEQWWSYPHPRQGKLPVSTRSRRNAVTSASCPISILLRTTPFPAQFNSFSSRPFFSAVIIMCAKCAGVPTDAHCSEIRYHQIPLPIHLL